MNKQGQDSLSGDMRGRTQPDQTQKDVLKEDKVKDVIGGVWGSLSNADPVLNEMQKNCRKR